MSTSSSETPRDKQPREGTTIHDAENATVFDEALQKAKRGIARMESKLQRMKSADLRAAVDTLICYRAYVQELQITVEYRAIRNCLDHSSPLLDPDLRMTAQEADGDHSRGMNGQGPSGREDTRGKGQNRVFVRLSSELYDIGLLVDRLIRLAEARVQKCCDEELQESVDATGRREALTSAALRSRARSDSRARDGTSTQDSEAAAFVAHQLSERTGESASHENMRRVVLPQTRLSEEYYRGIRSAVPTGNGRAQRNRRDVRQVVRARQYDSIGFREASRRGFEFDNVLPSLLNEPPEHPPPFERELSWENRRTSNPIFVAPENEAEPLRRAASRGNGTPDAERQWLDLLTSSDEDEDDNSDVHSVDSMDALLMTLGARGLLERPVRGALESSESGELSPSDEDFMRRWWDAIERSAPHSQAESDRPLEPDPEHEQQDEFSMQ